MTVEALPGSTPLASSVAPAWLQHHQPGELILRSVVVLAAASDEAAFRYLQDDDSGSEAGEMEDIEVEDPKSSGAAAVTVASAIFAAALAAMQ